MSMLGFTPGQQVLAGSAWGIAAIVGIFFSDQFADRNFAAQRFLSVSHLVGTALAASFATHFACFLLDSLPYVPPLSVTNTLAFSHLSDPSRDFGTVRIGGTLGWVVVSWPFIFLLDAHAGPDQVRWIFLVGALLSFVLASYALTLLNTPPRVDHGSDPLAWRRALGLLKTPFVAVLFIVTFIDSVVHNGYFVLSDAFLTNRVGIAGNLSMVVLSLGQIAEMLTMLILGVGMVVASFLFPALAATMSLPDASGHMVADYQHLFLVPGGLALASVVLLATAFKPPAFGPKGAHSVQGH